MSARSLLALALLLAGCGKSTNGGGNPQDSDTGPLISWTDTDGDTIVDVDEGYQDPQLGESVDTDGDGTPDYQDTDSDDDGIPDSMEAGDDDVQTLPWDSDADGVPDYRDDDADGNCILDKNEGTDDFDGDGVLDFQDLDDDADGIKDVWEIGADCAMPDSDGDGKDDYRDRDSDDDGVGDAFEAGTSPWQDEPADTDGDGTYDYLDKDSDGDGMPDAKESGGTKWDETPRDTDGDGTYDFQDTDSDNDGISDQDEKEVYKTDPLSSDSDGDGFSDGAELAAGTDPLDSGSVIDGLYVVVPERETVEQSFDFELNVSMGDVVFLLDTTCSMSGTLTGISSEFSTLVTDINKTLPDANYGVATFDDYAYTGMGSAGADKPFWLKQQVTDKTANVQSTLKGLKIDNGGDGPEAGMEALYQTLKGVGYDQACNGTYDTGKGGTKDVDVPEFISSSSDAFKGGAAAAATYDATVSGTGNKGGVGFRPYALPIVVYTTDNYLRDGDSSNGLYNKVPKGACTNHGSKDVITATKADGAYLIGISVSGSLPVPQMNDLADKTGSLADTDGDGVADDRLVFQWSGSSASLRTTIVKAIQDLVGSVQFSTISLEIEGDDEGFVTNIDPATYTLSSTASGQIIPFTLDFRGSVAATKDDQIFKLTLNVLGDGTVLLSTMDIYVLVPGTSY